MFIQVVKDTFLELNFHLVEDETHCPTFNRKKKQSDRVELWRSVFWCVVVLYSGACNNCYLVSSEKKGDWLWNLKPAQKERIKISNKT